MGHVMAMKGLDALANERTFLAWIRTAVALLGFGFVIVRFDVLLTEMGAPTRPVGGGEAVTVAGGLVALGALVRYLLGRNPITAKWAVTAWLPVVTGFLVLALAIFLTREITSTVHG